MPLEIEEEAEHLLSKFGMAVGSIPPSGTKVFLHRTANLSTHGPNFDVTDTVHEGTRAVAIGGQKLSGSMVPTIRSDPKLCVRSCS